MKKDAPAAKNVAFATHSLVTVEKTIRYGSIIRVTIHGINPASGRIIHREPARPIGMYGILLCSVAGK